MSDREDICSSPNMCLSNANTRSHAAELDARVALVVSLSNEWYSTVSLRGGTERSGLDYQISAEISGNRKSESLPIF